MWFRKRFRRKVEDVLNELRDERAAKQANRPGPDKSTIYTLDMDKIGNEWSLVKVISLLNHNGMTFILDEKEQKEFQAIIKKKYENS
jgi:hypothetical protein